MRVRLDSTGRDNRENRVMINPWFRLNRKADTSNGVNHFIQIKSRFVDQSFRHSDSRISQEGFYHVAYFDTVATLDSSHVRQFINEIDYSVVQSKNKFGLSFGYKNEINEIYQKADSAFRNDIIVFDAVFRPVLKKDTVSRIDRNFETHLSGGYILAGPNGGNYKIESNSVLVTNEKKKRNVFLDLLVERRNPDYIYNRWVSNHFLWLNNGFKAQQQLQVRAGINFKKVFKAFIFSQNISNFLYYDETALPKQLAGGVMNLGLNVSFTKVFFKHLGISLQHIFQNTNKPAYVRIPANISTGKLFFHANLFKSNLQFQFGGQIQIYETFKPYNYMPATQAFYLQDSYNTGSYPYLDVYLNVRIRPVSVFLKVENVLQGYAGNNYSFLPGYYQPDRAFRFGITWVFFD
jgi:hypothetical protein